MKIVVTLLAACWLLGCAAKTESSTASLDDQIYYFSETGHTVQAPFLVYYLAHDGPSRYGYPVTEALNHERWQVQYFQYARLEVHPENNPDYFITVGWLGQLSHRTKPPHVVRAFEQGRYYPETGHNLSGDFLTYFDNNGDTVQFGQPISEIFSEHGQLCQDFQSTRFCWRPELPPQARVQLEPIGETYFLSSDLPNQLLNPLPAPTTAISYSTSNNPPPTQTKTTLNIEPTARAEIIRITATLFANDEPLMGYTPILAWGKEVRPLPPTQSSGETHILINVGTEANVTFTLLAKANGKVLATITHTSSSPDQN